MFPRLYNCCGKKDALVRDCLDEGGLNIQFNRSFGALELIEWEELGEKLSNVSLQSGKDTPVWALEKSECYSTKSMYRFFMFRGVQSNRLDKLWKSKLPMKLKIFMWLALHEKLQTGVALKKKKWKGKPTAFSVTVPKQLTASFSSVLCRVLFGCVSQKFWVGIKFLRTYPIC